VFVAAFLGVPAFALGEVGPFVVGEVRLVFGAGDGEQMDAGDRFGVCLGEPGTDAGAEVAAVCEIPREAELRHEPVPQFVGRDAGHPLLLRCEGKPGQGGHDRGEGRCTAGAVPGGAGQAPGEFDLFEEGARPAVGEQDGHRIRRLAVEA